MTELIDRLAQKFSGPTIGTATSVSVGAPVVSWTTHLQIWATITMTAVAILSGVLAVWVSVRKLKLMQIQIEDARKRRIAR